MSTCFVGWTIVEDSEMSNATQTSYVPGSISGQETDTVMGKESESWYWVSPPQMPVAAETSAGVGSAPGGMTIYRK